MKPIFKHLINKEQGTIEHHVNGELLAEWVVDDEESIDLLKSDFEKIYMHGFNLRRKQYRDLKKLYTDEINDMSDRA